MNSYLKRIWTKAKDFFLTETYSDGSFLFFLRFTTGLFMIVSLLSISSDFGLLHGKYGIIPADVQSFVTSRYAFTFSDMVTIFEGIGISENSAIVIYFILYLLFAACLSIGLFTRISALMSLILYVSITSGAYKYGVDVFITTSLFYLFLFPSGHVKSLDNLIFKKRDRKINYTPYLRVLQINLCLIYFFAGISKAISISWYNGTAIWKTLNFAEANKLLNLNFDFLAANPSILSILGIMTVALELFYIFLIWHKKTSPFILYGVIAMHIGIGLVLNLYFFAAFMIILNLSAFYIEKKNIFAQA